MCLPATAPSLVAVLAVGAVAGDDAVEHVHELGGEAGHRIKLVQLPTDCGGLLGRSLTLFTYGAMQMRRSSIEGWPRNSKESSLFHMRDTDTVTRGRRT